MGYRYLDRCWVALATYLILAFPGARYAYACLASCHGRASLPIGREVWHWRGERAVFSSVGRWFFPDQPIIIPILWSYR